MSRLVLGSSSKWRADVLRSRGVPFEVLAPDIDEKAIRHSDAFQLTMRIAKAKARAVAAQLRDADALIIAADQVCVFDGEIREKPADADEARAFLVSYGNEAVMTVTAVVVMDARSLQTSADWDAAWVHFGDIRVAEAERAIARGDVLNSCGAFTLEDPDIGLCVTHIDGEKESVDGLPLALTRRLLSEFGYALP